MKNYSDITESLDITTKQYVDQGLSSKADTSELNKRVKLSATNATVGSTYKPIYVQNGTAVVATDVMKEAFLQWGGKNFSADYGPLDAALISDLGADRFAFIPAAKWQVEYSRDNGGTWQDYGATDAQKLSLTSVGTGLTIGNANSEHKATANDKLRLTLTTSGCVYSVLNKFAIDVSTNGSTGCYVTIEGRTKANVDAGVDTWVEFAKDITISGWSGWNIINTSGITTHGNTNNQYANLRFTFGCTGGNISEGSSYHGLQIRRLKAFGGVGWQTPSNMAQYGSLYQYDYSQNALFPADVYIRNNIKVASINDVHNGTLTIQKNGTTVKTFSANQSGNVTANITVPTKVSELTNDSGFTTNTGTITGIKMNGASKGTSGVVDLGTVLTNASAFATAAQGTKADNAMPKSGGTFTGEVKFGNTENFQGYYIKRMLGYLGAGTAYNNLDSSYKDGTWHRMWRLRFPSGSSFWGKIKITLYGGYSSFNASGVMSKSITCNFNTSNIYNNVGCYDGLGVNVEQDFRISEAIWNATASAWEVLIWQKNLNGNNSPAIMLECWTTNSTGYINAFNGIAAQTVELTRSTSYSAYKASSTGGTKTVMWEALPVYENPLGEEIATVAMLEDKQDKITSSNKLSASLVSDLATVATSGSYDDLSHKPTIPTVNNGTLTIQKNGEKVQTFSANQSSSVTANITVPTKASDVNALSLDGGTINKSKTVKMDASANSDGANLKWGTVNSKNPYIGYASDQVDGTFVVGSLLGTNYASGLAIGGGSGNLLWKGAKVAITSDIPDISGKLDKSAFFLSGTTLTITV